MNKMISKLQGLDIVWIVLDSLRYDVAQQLFLEKKIPNIARFLPKSGWQQCHTPASFTYPAHHAFFSGFLPTPINDSKAPRIFASEFLGSMTSNEQTHIFQESNIIESFKNKGYQTICIGGVGFFNNKTELSKVLPSFFENSYWREEFGVTDKNSTYNQFKFIASLLAKVPLQQRQFMFINVSAIHQPNNIYLDSSKEDDLFSHAAALKYIDDQLPILFKALSGRKVFTIICSDHGTSYGEDGYWGNRNAHKSVMEVPYTHFIHRF